MKVSATLVALATMPSAAVAAGGSFNYDQQEEWQNIVFQAPVTNDCAKDANSPIDIPANVADTCEDNDARIQFNSGDCTIGDLKFTSNDHGIKADFVGNCTKPSAKFPDYPELFVAAQFHVHTSCEHAVNGEGCDAEMHIVHFSEDTDLADPTTYKAAVVGMMISKDAMQPHAGMDGLLNCWARNHNDFVDTCNPDTCDVSQMFKEEAAACDDAAFDPYSLIPEGSGYYNYMGGLTTPPCSQVVRWNLMDTKISVTLKQWATIAQMILGYGGYVDDAGVCQTQYTVASKTGSTSRKQQAINERVVAHRCNVV
jgi:carbonic anhydrase